MKSLHERAREELTHLADPQRALRSKAYFKTPLKCLGVPKPEIDRLGKLLYKENVKQAGSPSMQALQHLWDAEIHELRTLALVIAGLVIAKQKPCWGDCPFDKWLEDCHTWDHLDELCIRVIGPMRLYDSGLPDKENIWLQSPNKWVRRASLITHLPAIRKNKASYACIEQCCKQLAPDEDFFIRKAIGWVLREISKVRPEITISIIQNIGHDLSPFSLKEGIRKLGERHLKMLEVSSSTTKLSR